LECKNWRSDVKIQIIICSNTKFYLSEDHNFQILLLFITCFYDFKIGLFLTYLIIISKYFNHNKVKDNK
jgi:hypothetical protein